MYTLRNNGIAFRCSGVIIAPDLIITTKECEPPYQNGTWVWWDIVKYESIKKIIDDGLLPTTQLFLANDTTQTFNEIGEKQVDWSSVERGGSGQIQVYELPIRMRLDNKDITEALISARGAKSSAYNGGCRIYGYGGNDKLMSLKVNDIAGGSCNNGKDPTHRICMKAENDYNLCRVRHLITN